MLGLRSQNDFEFHVKQVNRRGTLIKKQNCGYFIPGFDPFESETLAEVGRIKCQHLREGFNS